MRLECLQVGDCVEEVRVGRGPRLALDYPELGAGQGWRWITQSWARGKAGVGLRCNGSAWLRRVAAGSQRDKLGHLAEVLGGGCQEALVFGAARA